VSFDERRQFPRFTCRFPASADGARGPVRGTCADLSLGGLFLEGVVLNRDSLTVVTIEFPTGALTFQVQVRRVSTQPPGSGLQFTRLESQQLAVVQRFATPR
jgi:hypothetical protein